MSLNFTLVLQIISFLILLGVMTKFFYRPFLKYLDRRADEVRSLLEGAERDNTHAAENLNSSKRELVESRQEILKMKDDAVKEADELMRKAREEAKQEALELLEKAKAEIEKETDAAKLAIKKDVASVALEIAEKILEREVKDADHKRFIEKSLKELSNG
jgi:F-type H+-transporting ATPase subunit b